MKQEFDFSNYPKEHFLYNDENKDKPGKFKDETKSIPIKEFVGLRAKCYSVLYDRPLDTNKDIIMEKSTAAGVKKCIAKKELTHKIYRDMLLSNGTMNVIQNTISSKKHRVYTQQTERIGLSAYDDKRYILNDGVKTLAHGHYLTFSRPLGHE